MRPQHHLRAGAGTAAVEIGEDILPIEGFTSVRNPLHVRIVILESNIRTVIASVEITSLFEHVLENMLQRLCTLTGAARENVWLTTTHSFGGPHLWPTSGPKPTPPGRKPLTEEDLLRCARLERAYLSALEQAATAAAGHMRDAVMGTGVGSCTVNASRNIETRDGWWLGTNSEEPCDHSLKVLRVDGVDGAPIAMLYHYGVRSCVMKTSKGADGGKIITSDLCGVTSMALEREFGGAFTALFLCGAAADQEPQLKSEQTEMDKNGQARVIDLGSIGGALLDAQAARLTAEVLKAWRRADHLQDVELLRSGSRGYLCPTKKMGQTASLRMPTREAVFEPAGEKALTVYALRLGVLNLVGVQPEIDSVTSMQLAQAVPGELTAAVIQVNGGDKCMPERSAYEQIKYQSLNSPFQAGCAEIMRDTAVELLQSLSGEDHGDQ
jgi:hypothetical protein